MLTTFPPTLMNVFTTNRKSYNYDLIAHHTIALQGPLKNASGIKCNIFMTQSL